MHRTSHASVPGAGALGPIPIACDDTRHELTERLTRALPRPVLMRGPPVLESRSPTCRDALEPAVNDVQGRWLSPSVPCAESSVVVGGRAINNSESSDVRRFTWNAQLFARVIDYGAEASGG